MPNTLSSDDKNLLLKAADSVGINPASFAPGNPWAEESNGVLASQTLKAAIFKLNPQRASEWMSEGGIQLSLAAEATLNGERELTKEVWEELEFKMPHVVQERKEQEAKRLELKLEEDYEEYKEKVQTANKYRQASYLREKDQSTLVGNDWMRATLTNSTASPPLCQMKKSTK